MSSSNAQYIVSYGTFQFPLKVLNASASTIYEEDHVTVVGTNYSFAVDAWIFADNIVDFGAVINNVKCQLQTPRLPFVVQWYDGSAWTTLYSFTNANDIDYGPKPRDVNIMRFSGGRAARITFNLDVQVKECFGGSCGVLSRPSNVLAYTYSYSHDVDVDGITRRSVSGKLVITSTAVLGGLSPDAYRNYVTPAVPGGFQRQSSTYTTSIDGRTLSYNIVDQEFCSTLPQPVTSGDASFTAQQSSFGGSVSYVLSGDFTAPKSVPKTTLYQLMADLVSTKFPLNSAQIIGCAIESQEITERDMYRKNCLAFTIRSTAASQNTPTFQIGNFLAALPTLGISLPDSNGVAFVVNPYGGTSPSTGSGVIAAPVVLYDACSPGSGGMYKPGSNTPGGGYAYQGPTPGNGPVAYTPPDQTPPTIQYGDPTSGQLQAQWMEYVDVLRWVATNFIATMPSKDPTADPVMFQTAAPICTVLQAGYARRMIAQANDAPDPAVPYYDDTQAMMLDGSWNDAEVGQVIGTGPYALYTCRWYYKMRLNTNVNTGPDESATFPKDPRYTSTPPDFAISDGLIVDLS